MCGSASRNFSRMFFAPCCLTRSEGFTGMVRKTETVWQSNALTIVKAVWKSVSEQARKLGALEAVALSSIRRRTLSSMAKRKRMRPKRRTEAMISSPYRPAYSVWVAAKKSLNFACCSLVSVNWTKRVRESTFWNL